MYIWYDVVKGHIWSILSLKAAIVSSPVNNLMTAWALCVTYEGLTLWQEGLCSTQRPIAVLSASSAVTVGQSGIMKEQKMFLCCHKSPVSLQLTHEQTQGETARFRCWSNGSFQFTCHLLLSLWLLSSYKIGCTLKITELLR